MASQDNDDAEEINQIRQHLMILSKEYDEPFLTKIQEFSIPSQEDLIQTLADQIVHNEDTIRSLTELGNVLCVKCQDVLVTISYLENELGEQQSKFAVETEFQNQVSQQYQKLYSEQLQKNMELVEQLQRTEDKLDVQWIQFEDLQNSFKILERQKRTSVVVIVMLNDSQEEMEQDFGQQFTNLQRQLSQKLELQSELCSHYRETVKSMTVQVNQLRTMVVQLENDKQSYKEAECQKLASKIKQHVKIKSLKIEPCDFKFAAGNSPKVSSTKAFNSQQRVFWSYKNSALVPDEKLQNSNNDSQISLIAEKQTSIINTINNMAVGLSEKMVRHSNRILSRISEEQSPNLFRFNEPSGIMHQQFSVLDDPIRDTQSNDSRSLEEIKESLQDMYNKHGQGKDDKMVEQQVKWDLTLPSGKHLELQSGKNVDFLSNKSLVFPSSSNLPVGRDLHQGLLPTIASIEAVSSRFIRFSKQMQDSGSPQLQRSSIEVKKSMQKDIDLVENTVRIRKHMQNNTFKQQNPYYDFFKLVCQCVKLNSKRFDKVIAKDCNYLYPQLLEKQIPFNRWYQYIQNVVDR